MATDKKTKLKEQLAQSKAELEALLRSLDETQLHTPVISEDSRWTALDILAHLVENERGMSIHIHKIRQGRETVPEGFDLDQWNAGLKQRMERFTLPELLDSLNQTRARTLQELETINDEEWTLTGRHPSRGVITVEQYYETMVMHCRWHIRDIKAGLGL